MEGLLSLLVLGVISVALVSLVCTVFGVIWWVLVLPFQLLGFLFKGIGVLLTLPILLLVGFVGALVFGAGLFAFLLPALPFILIVWAIVWLARRGRPRVASAAR